MKKLRFVIIVGLFAAGTCLFAFNVMAEKKGPGPGGPPPEIEACKGKKSGESCSFRSMDGTTKTATCKKIRTPKGKELSCGDMPKPPKRGDKEGCPDGKPPEKD